MILSVCRSIFHYKLMWCKWVVCHPMLQNQPLWFYTDKCAIFLSFFVFTWLVYSHVIFCCLFLEFISVYHVQNHAWSSASCSFAMQGVKCHKESIFFPSRKWLIIKRYMYVNQIIREIRVVFLLKIYAQMATVAVW